MVNDIVFYIHTYFRRPLILYRIFSEPDKYKNGAYNMCTVHIIYMFICLYLDIQVKRDKYHRKTCKTEFFNIYNWRTFLVIINKYTFFYYYF